MVKQNLVSKSKYLIKCPYSLNYEYIVVHNTWNDASAWNEVQYMISNDKEVSFHYAIDDKEIVQGIPENRNAWHCGGVGNRKGLSVEICYSKSGGKRYEEAEKRAIKFIADKLKEKGWGIDKVKKHQDFSGKYCPHRILDNGWDKFLKKIENELTPSFNIKAPRNCFTRATRGKKTYLIDEHGKVLKNRVIDQYGVIRNA